jgi:hypothetical protein
MSKSNAEHGGIGVKKHYPRGKNPAPEYPCPPPPPPPGEKNAKRYYELIKDFDLMPIDIKANKPRRGEKANDYWRRISALCNI